MNSKSSVILELIARRSAIAPRSTGSTSSTRSTLYKFTALLLTLGACQRPAALNASSSIPTSGSTALVLHPEAPNARALLWRVERNNNRSYLFGTLHVGISMHDGLGPEGEAALTRSRVVCLEASTDDVGAARASLFHAIVRGQLPPGESLRAILGESDWPKVTSLMPAFPPAAIDHFDPSLAALFVLGAVQNREAPAVAESDGGVRDASASVAAPERAPMDAQIGQLAQSRGLRVMPLESMDEQIAMFRTLTREEALELIRSGARDPRSTARTIHAMERSYRGADAETEMEAIVARMRQQSAGFTRVLLDLRNEQWLPTLERVMGEGGAFVAVGAAHTVGSKGLVTLLRGRGFTVTRVHVGE